MQPKKGGSTRGGRTLQDDEIYGLYSSPNITVIKFRRMTQAPWTRDNRILHRVVIGKPERIRLHLCIHGRVVLKCSFSRRILLQWISPRQITVAEQATSLKLFSLMWHIFPELPKYAWVIFLFIQKQLQYLPNIQMIHKRLCQTIGSSNCFFSLLFCKKKTILSIQMVAFCPVTSCSLSGVYKQCTLICYHHVRMWQGN